MEELPIRRAAREGDLSPMEEFPRLSAPEEDDLAPTEEKQIIFADAEGVHCLVEELPMHRAARLGDVEEVRPLIELGMSVDILNIEGVPPLFCAASNGHSEVAELLIRNKCDVNFDEYYRSTPLMVSAIFGRKVVVDLLLQCGASIKGKDEVYFATFIHWASRHGWVDVVQCLVERGECAADTTEAKNGLTPLMWAALFGKKDVVAYLIKAGADVNRGDINERTALHRSSTYGHLEVVQILIQAGADVKRETISKRTALHYSSKRGHLEIVRILLENEGLDLNSQDCLGETPLHKASDQGMVEVVEKLLAAGADPSIKNNEGETAFSVGIKKEKLSSKEIGLFFQKGVFFEDWDYEQILKNSDIKERVLKEDVDLCTQSIINKFHYQALPTLYRNLDLAKKLPRIEKFQLSTQEIQDIEDFVEFDIKTNFFFDIVNARPIVLKLMCVKSLILATSESIT